MKEDDPASAPRVSVVLPIFNVEEYLPKCLRSLAGQTLRDIEVVCVDDGSSDRSGCIADEFAAGDARFRVFHQQNAGAGPARNCGVDHSCGDYLLFVDPDDWCDAAMVETLYRRAQETNADVVVSPLNHQSIAAGPDQGRGLSLSNEMLAGLAQPFAGRDAAEVLFNFTTSSPVKLFRRSYVLEQNLRFQAVPRKNDVLFVNTALACARRIATVEHMNYHYNDCREGSTHRSFDRHPTAFVDAYAALWKALTARGLDGIYARTFLRRVYMVGEHDLLSFQRPESIRTMYRGFRDLLAEAVSRAGGVDALPESDRTRCGAILGDETPTAFLMLKLKQTEALQAGAGPSLEAVGGWRILRELFRRVARKLRKLATGGKR